MLENLEVAILAGGRGTRMEEVTSEVPKPMIEIGNRPILWHIMKIFGNHGVNKFNIALGYKGHIIKEFFLNYSKYFSSMNIDLKKKNVKLLENIDEDWNINLIETGLESETGTRLYSLKDHLKKQSFFFTYGDGVANINLKELFKFHKNHGKIATITSVRPPSRFGSLNVQSRGEVIDFIEKPNKSHHKVSGGFFVLEPEIFNFLSDKKDCIFEGPPLEMVAKEGQLRAYDHSGFWQCMDTIRDLDQLNTLWRQNNAPWKNW